MTSITALRRQVKKIQPTGTVVVYFGDEPEPPHNPNDTVIHFTQGEERFL